MSSGAHRSSGELAIFGGAKVRHHGLPGRFAFGEAEFSAVQRVFEYYRARQSDFGYQGYFEDLYCREFVEFLGISGYADAVATGTGSLFVALAALQLPAGTHVLVSPITDPGSINAIVMNQLVPVLMDSMPGSYNSGLEEVRARLSDKVGAVMLVHCAGQAAPVDAIAPLLRDRGVKLLEDCSQAHGAYCGDMRVGTFGDIAAFSTMYRKNHATGACGGVVFTRHESLIRLVRAHADRGKPFWTPGFNDKDPKQFLFPALNWNQDELSCAIGSSSLGRLDSTNASRYAFVAALSGRLFAESRACRPYRMTEKDAPFFFPIFVDASRLKCSVREFGEAVQAEGISVNPHYDYLVREWGYLSPHLGDDFETPNAVAVRDGSFNLLFNEKFGAQEVSDVLEAILKVERFYIAD